jgi:hypothetical protein
MKKIIESIQLIHETAYYEKEDAVKTFFDSIEMGNNETEKGKLFRKLQDIAYKKGLILDTEDGLTDPITGRIYIDKDNDDPVQAIFKFLDIETLERIPVRTLTVDDLIKATKNTTSSFQDPNATKEFDIAVSVLPDSKADAESVLTTLNNMYYSNKVSLSNAGSGNSLYLFKFKAFTPKDITRDDMTQVVQSNKDMLQDMGIKTIDVMES